MIISEFKSVKEEFLKEQGIENVELFENNKCNEKAIGLALRKAYIDSQPRLIPGHKNIADFLWKENEDGDGPMSYLRTQIIKFLENENEEFQEWHKETCTKFIIRYKDIMKKAKIDENIIEKQGVGKAQKIINMTLKYLYCMADEEQESKYTYCHMPLDHYTLENWFCREVCAKKKVNCSKEELKAWSKISEYESYKTIQDAIFDYIEESEYKIDGKKMTPLQAEFIIWEEEKIREALLGVMNLDVDDKKKYYNVELKDIIDKASKVVDKLNKKYQSSE